jgi:hypothetical protein
MGTIMGSADRDQLRGRWVTDPEDHQSLREYGRISMEFLGDGRLFYTIHGDGNAQVMLLTYEVEGDSLITDQPSSPGSESTPYRLTPDGKLILIFEGYQSFYVRED